MGQLIGCDRQIFYTVKIEDVCGTDREPIVTRHIIENVIDFSLDIFEPFQLNVSEAEGSNLPGGILSHWPRQHVSSSKSGIVGINNSLIGILLLLHGILVYSCFGDSSISSSEQWNGSNSLLINI